MRRDSIKRGESIQEFICSVFRKKCGFECPGNTKSDKYDIDLEVVIEGQIVFVEVEETYKRYWPENRPKPSYPSGLLTMPLRKIKYFIREFKNFTEFTPQSIKEFINFVRENKISLNELSYIPNAYYMKTNYNAKYFFVVDSLHILKSLSFDLEDQDVISSTIRRLSRSNNFRFYNNIWENKRVRNYKGQPRDDKVLLIVGTLESSYIRWGKLDTICDIFKTIIKKTRTIRM
jgi:hypothetical protein